MTTNPTNEIQSGDLILINGESTIAEGGESGAKLLARNAMFGSEGFNRSRRYTAFLRDEDGRIGEEIDVDAISEAWAEQLAEHLMREMYQGGLSIDHTQERFGLYL